MTDKPAHHSLKKHIKLTTDFLLESAGNCHKSGGRLLMTSSFQTQSVPLLHLVSTCLPQTEVLFLDTGFLFAETYQFVQQMSDLLGLNVVVLRSETPYSGQLGPDGLFLYASDADRCCRINKVDPLHSYFQKGDYWISGVRRDQTDHRKLLSPIEVGEDGVTRIYPMLNWSSRNIYLYIQGLGLPFHPLEFAAYSSIGCVPCTHPCGPGREGRWEGNQKTECGLHIQEKI